MKRWKKFLIGFCFFGAVVMVIDRDIGAAVGYFIIAVTLLSVFLYLEHTKKSENAPSVPQPALKPEPDTAKTPQKALAAAQAKPTNFRKAAKKPEKTLSTQKITHNPGTDATTEIPQEALPAAQMETVNFRVAGISYCEDALMELAWENPEYELSKREIFDEGLDEQRIYQYEFSPKNVQLVEEPENPHDPNAIKVIVDSQHIGYIKAGSTTRVRNLLRSGKIEKITADIGGGPYKYAYTEEDVDDNYDTIEKRYVDKENIPYSCIIHIKIRK